MYFYLLEIIKISNYFILMKEEMFDWLIFWDIVFYLSFSMS